MKEPGWGQKFAKKAREAVQEASAAPEGIRAPPAEKNAASGQDGGKPAVLCVAGMRKRNPRMVVAYPKGGDPLDPLGMVSVTVRDNTNFIPGMEIPGPGRTLHETRPGFYLLQGQMPRSRGRW